MIETYSTKIAERLTSANDKVVAEGIKNIGEAEIGVAYCVDISKDFLNVRS